MSHLADHVLQVLAGELQAPELLTCVIFDAKDKTRVFLYFFLQQEIFQANQLKCLHGEQKPPGPLQNSFCSLAGNKTSYRLANLSPAL